MKKIKLNSHKEIILEFDEMSEEILFTVNDSEKSISLNLDYSIAREISQYFESQSIAGQLTKSRERIKRLKQLSTSLNFYEKIAITSEEPTKQTAEVFIGIPQEEISVFTIEKIQNACGNFMEALGFELQTEDEPVFGSFYQRFVFWSKKDSTRKEVSDIYNKGKKALEYLHLDKPSADITAQLSASASVVLESIKDIDEAVIRLGSILIVKLAQNGKTKVIIETISSELASSFDSNPGLMKNPHAAYELLIGEKTITGSVDEGENLIVE